MPTNNLFIAFLKLIRIQNLLIILASIFFLDYALYDHLLKLETLYLGLSVILIAAGGYIINDYYDVKIDVINKPDRVVIDRIISRKNALIIHWVISFSGVALGLFINWKIALVHVFCASLLWWYSNTLKRIAFWGNLSISILSSLTVILLYLIYNLEGETILFYSILIFLTSLAREIVKDIEDKKGDTSHGCRTIPIVLGTRKTKWIVYSLLITTIAFSVGYTFAILNTLVLFYSIIVLPYLGLLIFQLKKADTVASYGQISTHLKWVICLGIISILYL